MDLFKDAMLKGLASAQISLDNFEEINDILLELSRTVEANSRSAAVLYVEDTTKVDRVNIPFDKQGAWHRTIFIGEPVKEGNKERVTYKMAFLSCGENGYPCTLTYRNQTQQALDKESLLVLMSEWLQSPSTGRTILHFINMQKMT